MLKEADEDEEFHDAMEEESPEGIVVEDVEESKEEDEDEDKDETVQHSNFSDRPPFYQSLEPLRCKPQHPKQCGFIMNTYSFFDTCRVTDSLAW